MAQGLVPEINRQKAPPTGAFPLELNIVDFLGNFDRVTAVH